MRHNFYCFIIVFVQFPMRIFIASKRSVHNFVLVPIDILLTRWALAVRKPNSIFVWKGIWLSNGSLVGFLLGLLGCGGRHIILIIIITKRCELRMCPRKIVSWLLLKQQPALDPYYHLSIKSKGGRRWDGGKNTWTPYLFRSGS